MQISFLFSLIVQIFIPDASFIHEKHVAHCRQVACSFITELFYVKGHMYVVNCMATLKSVVMLLVVSG